MSSNVFTVNGTTKLSYFVFVALLTYLHCGLNRASLALLFHQLDDHESYIKVDNEQKSLIAAYCGLLSPLGCMIAGICMDLLGRKVTLQLIYVPYIAAWTALAFAKNVNIFYVSYLSLGISSGMSFSVVTYLSEICPPKFRGSLLSMTMLNFNCGMLLINCLMYFFKWYTVASMMVGISIVSLALTYSLPESPTWLYTRGKKNQSIKTLCSIRCQNVNDLQSEIQDLENYCSSKQKVSITQTIKDCFIAWKQLLTLVTLCICSVHTGYTIMIVYGVMIINQLHVPYDSAQILIIYSLMGVLSSFVAPYFIEKFARKTVLVVSCGGMAICALIIGSYLEVGQETFDKFVWIVPTILFVYSFCANLGDTQMPLIMGGELLPNESRGVLSGLQGSCLYLYISGIQKLYPGFLTEYGMKISIWTCAVSCLIMILFTIFFLPETKGKTLNQVQEEYFKKKSRVNVAPEHGRRLLIFPMGAR